MQNIKKAFSFVELIVVLAILALLAIIGVNMYNSVDDKTNNSKVITGAKTLNNAFTNYLQVEKELPNPAGNKNYFKVDSSYAHHEDSDIFGVYGSVTEETLPKKYLDNLPLDPVSNHYYAYGKTMNNEYFEIASILRKDGDSKSKLEGTYPGENGTISLIREYNGPQFLQDNSSQHLPYNPDEHILTARIIGDDFNINGISVSGEKLLRTGDTIELAATKYAQLYFADGSVSLLGDESKQTKLTLSDLDFKDPKDNLLTKVRLYLSVGSIFTQATALNNESDFEIYTSDTTAAVRGTEFLVSTSSAGTEVIVLEGEVEVYETSIEQDDINKYKNGDISGVVNKIKDFEKNDFTKLKSVLQKESITIKESEVEETVELNTDEIMGIEDKLEQYLPILGLNIPQGQNLFDVWTRYWNESLFENTRSEEWNVYAAVGFDYPENLELRNKDYVIIGKTEHNGIEKLCTDRTGSGSGDDVQCNINKWKTDYLTGFLAYNDDFSFLSNLFIKKTNAFFPMIVRIINSRSSSSSSSSPSSSSPSSSVYPSPSDLPKIEYNQEKEINGNVVYIDSSFVALKDGVNGILIDNQDTDKDYLKYTDLDLGDNFAIETRVRGAALLRSDDNYTLLKLNNYKLQLNNGSGNLELYNGSTKCATLSGSADIETFIPDENNNNFYKVILSNEKLIIADDSGNTKEAQISGSNCNMSNINSIILGADHDSSFGYKQQWNGIIDYLKIYKREE